MLLNGNFSGHLPVQLVLNEILRHPLGTFRKTLSRVFCIIPDRIVLTCNKRDLKLSETMHPLYPKCTQVPSQELSVHKNFWSATRFRGCTRIFVRKNHEISLEISAHFRLNNSRISTKFVCNIFLFAQYCIFFHHRFEVFSRSWNSKISTYYITIASNRSCCKSEFQSRSIV